MEIYKGQSHYSPLSVGAFVDPAFLRAAASEDQAERHAVRTPSAPFFSLRWAGALRALAAALRRR